MAKGEEELGILIEVTGEDPPRKNCLALLRASLLHWGFPGTTHASRSALVISRASEPFAFEGDLQKWQ